MTEGSSAEDLPELSVSVLGPLGLVIDGAEVEVPGAKRRAVLALLAMATPASMSTERLVDALWPDELFRAHRALGENRRMDPAVDDAAKPRRPPRTARRP